MRSVAFAAGLSLILFAGCAERASRPAPSPVGRLAESTACSTLDVSDDLHWEVSGRNGAVATGSAGSVAAGIEILQSGGNAADAAAATLIALAVTEPTKYGLGGEVPIMVYQSAPKTLEVICGQGEAPALATLEYFQSIGGIPRPGKNLDVTNSNRNAAVPGAFHAILMLLDNYGTMTFAQVAAPSIRLLAKYSDGWQADLCRTLSTLVAADADVRANGATRSAGIAAVAYEFYGRDGAIARRIVAWSEASGGLLRADDLANHATRIEEPVSVRCRGYTVYKCGPWTQGPWLLETLRILEGYNLRRMGHDSADYVHVVAEAMKLGLADRDAYLADPDFADVPLSEMISPRYARIRRPLIDMKHASLEVRPGDPRKMKALAAPRIDSTATKGPVSDTTTCIVADRWGNVIVATPSGWGGALAGDTGIWLGSRLSSLNTWPGHPNVVAPGKRPRTTLTPTLVFKNGKPVIAVSVAGGDMQDQVTLNLLLDVIDFGMPPGEAVSAARFGTSHLTDSFGQAPPKLGSLEINPQVGDKVIDDLKSRGHAVTTVEGAYWAPSMMVFDPRDGSIRAAGDPAASRHSAAY